MDDSINREKALLVVKDVCDAILSCCDSYYDEVIGDEVYSDVKEVDAILKCNKEINIAIKNIPSTQSERPTGRWKKSYADHEAFGVRPFFRYCSECHEATVHQYNYCPNCGAMMEVEHEID